MLNLNYNKIMLLSDLKNKIGETVDGYEIKGLKLVPARFQILRKLSSTDDLVLMKVDKLGRNLFSFYLMSRYQEDTDRIPNHNFYGYGNGTTFFDAEVAYNALLAKIHEKKRELGKAEFELQKTMHNVLSVL